MVYFCNMKILYFSAYEEDYGGGEGKITWELAHESVRIGNEVMMLAPNVKGRGFKFGKSNDLNIYFYPSLSILEQLYVFAISPLTTRRLYQFLDEFNPDIIHFHTAMASVFLLEAWAIKHHKVVVHSIHENPNKMLSYMAFKRQGLLDRISKKMGVDEYLRTMYRYTNCLVSVNDIHNQEIRNFGYNGPLVTILNGRNLDRFDTLALPSLSDNTIKLFFVGFICERKNQRYLIEVLKHLPNNYELYFIGEPLFKTYQKSLPKSDRVHYLGQRAFDELPKLMEGFHICASASIEEAFSLSIIEALAAGKPVVGLQNDTIDRLITTKNGKSLPVNTSPKNFASEIQKIAKLKQGEYDKMATEARDSVKLLSWDRAMLSYQELYTSLITGKQVERDIRPVESILDLLGVKKTVKRFLNSVDKNRNIVKLRTIGTLSAVLLASIAVGYSISKLFTRKKK